MFHFIAKYFYAGSYDPFNESASIKLTAYWGNTNQTINAFWGNTNQVINALWGFSMTPTALLTQNLGSIRNDVATSIVFALDGVDIDPNATVYFNLSFLSIDKSFFSTICPRSGNNFQAFIPPNINPKMPSATANFSLYWNDTNGPKVLAAGTISIEQWVQS